MATGSDPEASSLEHFLYGSLRLVGYREAGSDAPEALHRRYLGARRRAVCIRARDAADARRHVRAHAGVERGRADRDARRPRTEARRSLQPDAAALERNDHGPRHVVVDAARRVDSHDEHRRQRRLLQLLEQLADRRAHARRRDRTPSGDESRGARRRHERKRARRSGQVDSDAGKARAPSGTPSAS